MNVLNSEILFYDLRFNLTYSKFNKFAYSMNVRCFNIFYIPI